MRTAQRLLSAADWADRLLVLCDGCRVLAGLFLLTSQQRDEKRCREGHCYERESELFRHVHPPWLRNVCVLGDEVCDANHRSRDFGWWALAPTHPSSVRAGVLSRLIGLLIVRARLARREVNR